MMRFCFLLVVIALFVLSSVAQENTVLELLASQPNLSQFNALLEFAEPELLEELNEPSSEFTIFAPSDSAIEQLISAIEDSESWEQTALGYADWDAFLADTELVTEFIKMHIIPELLVWDDLIASLEDFQTPNYRPLNGDFYSITATLYNTGDIDYDQGIRITLGASINLDKLDLAASNGHIYEIDYPLIPETRTIGEIIAEDAAYGPDEGEFLFVWQLIQNADPSILELLNDESADISFFAPYDDAFEGIAFGQLLSESAATAFLQNYIIPDASIFSFQIGDGADFEALSGELLNLIPDEGAYYGEFFVNDTYTAFPDRVAKNGVIHELESLLAN